MNILSFLNISNIDNINCDSGYIFQTQLGNALIESGNKFTLVIPAKINNGLINFHYHSFGLNKFQVRFSFDWTKINEIISIVNPDIIISNQPELSSNIKALIISEHLKAKLYTYVHYYPFSVSNNNSIIYDPSLNNDNFCKSIIFTFISGILASDKILVHSQYSILLLNSLFKYFNLSIKNVNISILPPPYDEFISHGELINMESENILYNHRLYKQYGTDFLIEFAYKIIEQRNQKVIITDLLFNRNVNRITLDSTVDDYRNKLLQLSNIVFRTDGNVRETYRDIICTSKISLAPYRQNCTWSMSVIDCMSVGLPVVAPHFAWFKEFIPKRLLFSNIHHLIEIINQLKNDKIFYNEMSSISQNLVLKESKLSKKEVTDLFLNLS